LGERHADVPGRVPHHERHELRRGHLGREDQIALVLAVLGVDHDDRLAGLQVGDRVLDRLEPAGRHRPRRLVLRTHRHRAPASSCADGALPYPAVNRSTYFATTSTSRFTVSPGFRIPSVVCDNVVGISATVNVSVVTPATVSETPSTVIEPFSTT